jgi:hypothetical protein
MPPTGIPSSTVPTKQPFASKSSQQTPPKTTEQRLNSVRSQTTARTVKRVRLRSAGLVARMDIKGMRAEFLLGKSFRNRPLGWQMIWEDNIKMHLTDWVVRMWGCEGRRGWVELAQNHNQWRAFR